MAVMGAPRVWRRSETPTRSVAGSQASAVEPNPSTKQPPSHCQASTSAAVVSGPAASLQATPAVPSRSTARPQGSSLRPGAPEFRPHPQSAAPSVTTQQQRQPEASAAHAYASPVKESLYVSSTTTSQTHEGPSGLDSRGVSSPQGADVRPHHSLKRHARSVQRQGQASDVPLQAASRTHPPSTDPRMSTNQHISSITSDPSAKRPRMQKPDQNNKSVDTAAAQASVLAAQLKQKQAEMAALRAKLEQAEVAAAKLKEQEAAREAARLQQLQQEEEARRRREQLERGFQSIAEAAPRPSLSAARTPEHPEPAAKPSIPATANEWDVARVLDSRSDYECLQVPASATLAEVKRSYRSLAILLHPDKCKLEGAAAAFQRLNQAYDRLSRL